MIFSTIYNDLEDQTRDELSTQEWTKILEYSTALYTILIDE